VKWTAPTSARRYQGPWIDPEHVRRGSPALVSTGVALERLELLTPEELARADALATARGLSREALMGLALAAGSALTTANDERTSGSAMPPSAPPNDTTRRGK
jgi:hypothetical protein